MPPRPRPSSLTNDEPPAARPRAHRFSVIFNDPDGDIILRSPGGLSFKVQRAPLQAASSVFADMFSLPRPAGSANSELEVVDLTERGDHLERFLRFVFPQNFLVDSKPPTFEDRKGTLSTSLVESLLEAAQKYDTPVILHTVARMALPELLEKQRNVLRVWYLACRFKHLDIAKMAIRQLSQCSAYDEVGEDGTIKTVVLWNVVSEPRGREVSLADLPIESWQKLETKVLHDFVRLHAKVTGKERFTWEMAAEEFTF